MPPRTRGVAVQSDQSVTGDLFFRRGPRAATPHSGRPVRQNAAFRVRPAKRLCISEGALHHNQPIASNHGCTHSRLKKPLACLITKAKTRPHLRPGARLPRSAALTYAVRNCMFCEPPFACPGKRGRKESHMLKLGRNIRWIIPLLLIAIVVAYFVVAPVLGAHAATAVPNTMWGGK